MGGTSPTVSLKAIRSVTSKASVRRLLKPAPPIQGESLRGLVADACARNHIPNTFGLLQHFGLRHRNRVDVSESDDINTAGLAAALAIDEAEVDARRYPNAGRRYRCFYGLRLSSSRLENRIRRFSPAAIASGYLHHPAVHELRDLPFSLLGWDMLQESCPCTPGGSRQGWTRVNGTARCDICGGRLDHIEPIFVPDRLRPSLAVLVGMVDTAVSKRQSALSLLPASIQSADRKLLFDTTISLGEHVFKTGDGRSPMQKTEAIAKACEAILHWPHGMPNLRPQSVRSANWEDARRNYLLLDKCQDAPLERTDGLSQSAQRLTDPKAIYQPRGRFGRVRQPFLSAMAGARLIGIDDIAVKQAWDDKLVTQHSSVLRGNRVRAFDPEELIRLAPRLRRAIPRARAARMLGISIFGIEQLSALGAFRPDAPSGDRGQAEAHLAETIRLIDLMQEAVSETVDGPIPLVEAVRHISGRPKPWGVILSNLLEGKVPYVCAAQESGTPLTKRISIPRERLPYIVSLRFDRNVYPDDEFEGRWRQSDALECLNGDVNAPELLTTLTSIGTRPKWYLAAEVEELAANGVTTSDLARRANMDVKRIYLALDKAGVQQLAPGLWSRVAAERIVL